jgi:hypothetical protein
MGLREVGWVSGGSSLGTAGFCVPCVCGCFPVVVVEDVYVRDCRGLGLCKVGTISLPVGDECIGGRGSLVTGRGTVWVRRGRMSCWGGEHWILAQEKEGQ